MNNGLVEIRNLVRYFPIATFISGILGKGQRYVKAVDGVSLNIRKGEVFGLVGESGCGKTTIGRLLALLDTPDKGVIRFKGVDLAEVMKKNKKLRDFRKRVQMILQDPYESLDPRYTVLDTIIEPLNIQKIRSKGEQQERIRRILRIVGLTSAEILNKFPHELSGGQRQRVSIARAMILEPEFIIADEPVSMLDVSVRAEILRLFENLREQFKVTCLFISHDFAVVRYLCDRIGIMYMGKIMEIGSCDEIIHQPKHPYTAALISAVPIPDPRYKRKSIALTGEVPDALNIPSGCRFHPRCQFANGICQFKEPVLEDKNGRLVACFKC